MKKVFITIFLFLLALLSYEYNLYLENNKNNVSFIYTKQEAQKENDILNIKIYNVVDNKIENKEILVKDKRFLSETDVVTLTLDNLSYLDDNMKLISIYELENNDRIILLSNSFKKLSRVSSVATTTVLKLNLKENFNNINKIEIQFER